MKIVGTTTCTAGIAHAYTIKEKLKQITRKLGYIRRIEARENIGIEGQLTPEEIQEADVVILATGTKISGEDRFKGKPVMHVSAEKIMKSTGAMLQNIEEAPTKKKSGGN